MKFAASPGNYNGRLSWILQWVKSTRPISEATFLRGKPRKSSPMGFYEKTLQLSLAKRLSALLRNSPERHHLYWLNTMKPINLPPSLSTGRATIVPLLLCNSYGRKISKNFRGFDIATLGTLLGTEKRGLPNKIIVEG